MGTAKKTLLVFMIFSPFICLLEYNDDSSISREKTAAEMKFFLGGADVWTSFDTASPFWVWRSLVLEESPVQRTETGEMLRDPPRP